MDELSTAPIDGLKPQGRFLTEPGIDADHPDEFRTHTQIAKTLCQVVETCRTPFTIGLFGGWGSGKTYILGLLREKIRNQYQPAPGSRVKVVYLDVWKYSRDPLRWWILLEMERQLAEYDPKQFGEFRTPDGRTLKSHLYATEVTSTKRRAIRPGVLQLLRQFSWVFAAILAVIAIRERIILGAPWLTVWNRLGQAASSLAILLLAFPIVFEMVRHLGRAFWYAVSRDEEQAVSVGPVISAELFAALFRQMVATATASSKDARLVLCLDNIDRAPAHVAFDTLSTIGTFMDEKRCVYVVPCDDRTLRHSLSAYARWTTNNQGGAPPSEAEIRSGDEFLLKIFQLTLRLPAIIPVDMQSYLNQLVTDANIAFSDDARDVVLAAYGAHSPRHLKRFVNDFIGYTQLAGALETANLVGHGELTKNQAALAKMVVLHLEWPQFILDLAHDPDAWDEIRTAIAHQRPLPPVVNDPSLDAFLRQTLSVEVGQDLLPWLFLKRLSIDPGGKFDAQIRRTLTQQDIEAFCRWLDQPGELDRVLALTRLQVVALEHRPVTATATMRTLLGAWHKTGEAVRAGLGPMTETLLRKYLVVESPSVPHQLKGLEGLLDAAVEFIKSLPAHRRTGFVTWAVRAFSPGHPVDLESLKTLAPILNEVTPDQRTTVAYNLTQGLHQQPPGWAPLLACRGVLDRIVTPELAAAVTQRVDPSDTSPAARENMDLYLTLQYWATPDERKTIGSKVSSVAIRTDSTAKYGIETIPKLEPDSFTPEVADRTLQAFLLALQQGHRSTELIPWFEAYPMLRKVVPQTAVDRTMQTLTAYIGRLDSNELIPLMAGLSIWARGALFELDQVQTAIVSAPTRWLQRNPNAAPDHAAQLYKAIGIPVLSRDAAKTIPLIDARTLPELWNVTIVAYEAGEIHFGDLDLIGSSLGSRTEAEQLNVPSDEIAAYVARARDRERSRRDSS